MKLFVDDVREAPRGWRVARTVEEAVALLDEGGVEEVSLDYMIGYDEARNFSPVARRIAALPAEKRPRTVYIHTSSAAGAAELRRILQGAVEKIVRI